MIGVDHPLVLVVDWVVAAVLAVGALVTLRRSRPTAVLLLVAAGTWVLAGWLLPVLFWHRAVLVHLLLAHPGWRPVSRPATAVVLSTYLVATVAPVLLSTEAATWMTAAVVPAAAAWNVRSSGGVRRHLRRSALLASLALAAGLLAGSLLRSVGGPGLIGTAVLVYDTAVVLVVAVLAGSLRPPEASRLTDLVVDLDQTRAASLRDALATTLHDPDLRLGYWDSAAAGYRDHEGRLLPAAAPPGRALLPLEPVGHPLALILLDAELARDPGLVESIRVAIRAVELNRRRQAELQAQVVELQDSRRRLLSVADDERRRLEHDLESGIVTRLRELAAELDRLGPGGAHLARARGHLAGTVEDLRVVASGLRPAVLDGGLPHALAILAERSPVPTKLRGTDEAATGGVPADVELTAWFLCAEALSNCAKHAPGASATIALSCGDGVLEVRVCDDGPGGAVLVDRGGLEGLRDRVEALGGRLCVSTGPTGTSLAAELPMP